MERLFYDQPFNLSFSNKKTKIESVQENESLGITGAIKSASCDKLNQELEFEYLQQRRWMMRLCLLYKFLSTEQPLHIHNLLPHLKISHRHPNTFHEFPSKTEYLENSFCFSLCH